MSWYINKTTVRYQFWDYFQGMWQLFGPAGKNLQMGGANLTGEWQLPTEGFVGIIRNTDGYCLSANDKTDVHVVLENNDPGRCHQWERSHTDSLGFFTLKSLRYGKFLYARDSSNLLLEGM